LAELQEYQPVARCRVPSPVAVAAGIYIVVVAVLIASMGHFYNFATGAESDIFQQVMGVVLFTIPGVIIGGQIGPLVQASVNPDMMKIAISFLFISVGVFMLQGAETFSYKVNAKEYINLHEKRLQCPVVPPD